MTTIYIASAGGVSVVKGSGEDWSGSTQLVDKKVECVLADPRDAQVAYCGTFGSGLYKTTDAGSNWLASSGLAPRNVSALAVNRSGSLFAGTEPSEVFRSDDGGIAWNSLPGLSQLPSAREWSFPPRPHTHHVRAILPDRDHPDDLHVAVEAGALVRSRDAGTHWLDRVPGSPRDTHWLVADPLHPHTLFSAAGDGFFQSEDDGTTWRRMEEGLEETYCWSIAISFGTSGVQLMSAASGAHAAHYERYANSSLYRREGDNAWTKVRDGLPENRHHRASVITEDTGIAGVFYLSTEGAIFRYREDGRICDRLRVDWRRGKLMHAVDISVSL